jgi:hypothetical protein
MAEALRTCCAAAGRGHFARGRPRVASRTGPVVPCHSSARSAFVVVVTCIGGCASSIGSSRKASAANEARKIVHGGLGQLSPPAGPLTGEEAQTPGGPFEKRQEALPLLPGCAGDDAILGLAPSSYGCWASVRSLRGARSGVGGDDPSSSAAALGFRKAFYRQFHPRKVRFDDSCAPSSSSCASRSWCGAGRPTSSMCPTAPRAEDLRRGVTVSDREDQPRGWGAALAGGMLSKRLRTTKKDGTLTPGRGGRKEALRRHQASRRHSSSRRKNKKGLAVDGGRSPRVPFSGLSDRAPDRGFCRARRFLRR